MSLSCEIDGGYGADDSDWWWYPPSDEAPLATKRCRKCASCKQRIAVGDTARKIQRFRSPTEFEERIHGDAVALADWHLCESCGDLADSLSELGYCYELGGESLKEQIAEYRREEALHRERMMSPLGDQLGIDGLGGASVRVPASEQEKPFPHAQCKEPATCRKEGICIDAWNCSSGKPASAGKTGENDNG